MNRSLVSTLAATLLALNTAVLTGCKKDEPEASATGKFTLHLDNGTFVPGGNGPIFSSLVLGSGAYSNANSDDFRVSTFKYYVSNVKLLKADNSAYTLPRAYYLVDQSKPTTQDLEMNGIPVGDYTAISFIVGVDSARTKAGNFTEEALNANSGMLWTMNGVDEFINLSLTGYSSKSPSTGLTFHIAGYKHSTTNTIRTVTVPFPAANSPMRVRPDHSPEIHLYADINKMFTGTSTIKFADTYNVMGGLPAVKIADNIAAGMFSVGHIYAN
ncbi:hypothetical protein GCM10022409_19700 [Hymenobacter glaciei]|uniref:Copper-binding protein MbnP-like domain-containing protein n=1 Tax=Hymenobacter glaciei TaxID=877209 RepID=A0ABP7U357_9BACT